MKKYMPGVFWRKKNKEMVCAKKKRKVGVATK